MIARRIRLIAVLAITLTGWFSYLGFAGRKG